MLLENAQVIQIAKITKVVLTKYAKILATTHSIHVEVKPDVLQVLTELYAPVKLDLLAMLLRSATNVIYLCLISHQLLTCNFEFEFYSWMQDK